MVTRDKSNAADLQKKTKRKPQKEGDEWHTQESSDLPAASKSPCGSQQMKHKEK